MAAEGKELALNPGSLSGTSPLIMLTLLLFAYFSLNFFFKEAESHVLVTTHPLSSILTILPISSPPYRV